MAHNVFVAMPFKRALDPVLDVIKDAGKLLNTSLTRIDEQPTTGSIISNIRSEIAHSDVMVAVVSEENGNVYYEIGLAHCQKKPVVLLTPDPSTLKFDLRDHRAIVYDPNNPEKVRDELVRTIEAALHRPKDPEEFIETAFGSPNRHDPCRAIDKAVETVVRRAGLKRPAKLTYSEVDTENNELAIEVTDFLETRVRAIFDINGIMISSKRMAP
jgi:hypothetical protein